MLDCLTAYMAGHMAERQGWQLLPTVLAAPLGRLPARRRIQGSRHRVCAHGWEGMVSI